MTVHDFREKLEMSHSYSEATWWLDVYRAAFPDLVSAVCVRSDGWAQRGGIDRVLTLDSGRVVTIDEKVREKDYGDILLEFYSDNKRKTRGWVCKDLACDFIAYAVIPSRTCYLLPALILRKAWRENYRAWLASYKRIYALNRGYITESVAVPPEVLFGAINNSITLKWSEAA